MFNITLTKSIEPTLQLVSPTVSFLRYPNGLYTILTANLGLCTVTYFMLILGGKTDPGLFFSFVMK